MSYLPLVLISMVSLGSYYFLVKLLSVHISSLVLILIGSMLTAPVIYTYLLFTQKSILPKRKIYTLYALIVSIMLILLAR